MDLTTIKQEGAFQVTYWSQDEATDYEVYDTLEAARARYDFLKGEPETKSVSICLTIQSTDYSPAVQQ